MQMIEEKTIFGRIEAVPPVISTLLFKYVWVKNKRAKVVLMHHPVQLGVIKPDLHTPCSSERGILNSHNDCHNWDDGEMTSSRLTS